MEDEESPDCDVSSPSSYIINPMTPSEHDNTQTLFDSRELVDLNSVW